LKKTSSALPRHEHKPFRDCLLVGAIRNFGKRVQPFGYRSKREESAAAMIMQRPLSDAVARKQKALRGRVPQHESEIADKAVYSLLAPTIEAFEQNRRVAKLPGLWRRQA